MTVVKHGAEDQAENEAGARAVMFRGSTIGITTDPGFVRVCPASFKCSLGLRFPFEDIEAIENWVDLEKVGRRIYCTWRGRRAWRWTAFSFRMREQLGLGLIMV